MEIEAEPSPTSAEWEGGWPQTPREFERLVEVYQHRLVRFAFRRLGELGDAEDVAQEVFVRAYAEREKRRAVANVRAYLYRMASNLCADHLRRRKRHGGSIEDLPAAALAVQTIDASGPRKAAAEEEVRRIDALLRRIPPAQAEVVRLRVFDELGPREIAAVLNCREGTVKSRLRYGLEKLRELIDREWEVSR